MADSGEEAARRKAIEADQVARGKDAIDFVGDLTGPDKAAAVPPAPKTVSYQVRERERGRERRAL